MNVDGNSDIPRVERDSMDMIDDGNVIAEKSIIRDDFEEVN